MGQFLRASKPPRTSRSKPRSTSTSTAPTRIVNGAGAGCVTSSTSSKDCDLLRRGRFAAFGFLSGGSPSLPSFHAHQPNERSEYSCFAANSARLFPLPFQARTRSSHSALVALFATSPAYAGPRLMSRRGSLNGYEMPKDPSAIPHFGQSPGSACSTSGCIGQVKPALRGRGGSEALGPCCSWSWQWSSIV